MSTTSDNHIMFSYSWKSGHEKVHDIARKFQAADIPIWMDIYNGLGPNLLDGMAEAVEGSAADTTQKCAVGRMDSPEEQSSSYNGFLPDIFSTQTGYRASQNLQSEYSTLHGDWSIQPLSVCTDHRNSNISKTRTAQGTSRNDETQLPLNYKDYLWCNYLDN
ncbi:unnamed protein product [Rotaria sordida]|uniref:TIR domain-containing protein n=1 Tax=Rotaria sordida TaxID=392033 RepID=A0A815BTC7_9BILA|nr:unnamed protein product [Rotaria sordida]